MIDNNDIIYEHCFVKEFTSLDLLTFYPMLIWDKDEKKIYCTKNTMTIPKKYDHASVFLLDTRHEKEDSGLRYGIIVKSLFWKSIKYGEYPSEFKAQLLLLGIE